MASSSASFHPFNTLPDFEDDAGIFGIQRRPDDQTSPEPTPTNKGKAREAHTQVYGANGAWGNIYEDHQRPIIIYTTRGRDFTEGARSPRALPTLQLPQAVPSSSLPKEVTYPQLGPTSTVPSRSESHSNRDGDRRGSAPHDPSGQSANTNNRKVTGGVRRSWGWAIVRMIGVVGMMAFIGWAVWNNRESSQPYFHLVRAGEPRQGPSTNSLHKSLLLPGINYNAHDLVPTSLSSPALNRSLDPWMISSMNEPLSTLAFHTIHLSYISHRHSSDYTVQSALKHTLTLTAPLITSATTFLDAHTSLLATYSSLIGGALERSDSVAIRPPIRLFFKCFSVPISYIPIVKAQLKKSDRAEEERRTLERAYRAAEEEAQAVRRVLEMTSCIDREVKARVERGWWSSAASRSDWWQNMDRECGSVATEGHMRE